MTCASELSRAPLGTTMQRYLPQLVTCGCVWVACVSCAPAMQLGDGHDVNQTSKSNAIATDAAPPAVVERRIAALVERALSRTARTPSRARPSMPVEQTRASDNRQTTFENSLRNAVSDRNETLRVTSTSGDFCAAVSIASQLAVTALHCVQALCESELAPVGRSLLGCRLNYELPDGTGGEATVVTTSDNDLLALLDLHHPLLKYGVLRCDDPHMEDRVYTVSHPAGDNWLVSYGWLTREPIAIEWVDGQSTRVLVAQIPTKRGSSGGGLFDSQDRLVGVQIARWSPWSTDYGKAAFIQATRIFNLAGRYCMKDGSSACIGLRCMSKYYDVWRY